MKIRSGITANKVQEMSLSEVKATLREVSMTWFDKRNVSRKEYAIRKRQSDILWAELDTRI